MRRSKLEMYVDVLNVLAQRGPLKLTHIMYKANLNCDVLKECLNFLIKQNLIEERKAGKRNVVYANTPRGTQVTKFFKELNKALPLKKKTKSSQFPIKKLLSTTLLPRMTAPSNPEHARP